MPAPPSSSHGEPVRRARRPTKAAILAGLLLLTGRLAADDASPPAGDAAASRSAPPAPGCSWNVPTAASPRDGIGFPRPRPAVGPQRLVAARDRGAGRRRRPDRRGRPAPRRAGPLRDARGVLDPERRAPRRRGRHRPAPRGNVPRPARRRQPPVDRGDLGPRTGRLPPRQESRSLSRRAPRRPRGGAPRRPTASARGCSRGSRRATPLRSRASAPSWTRARSPAGRSPASGFGSSRPCAWPASGASSGPTRPSCDSRLVSGSLQLAWRAGERDALRLGGVAQALERPLAARVRFPGDPVPEHVDALGATSVWSHEGDRVASSAFAGFWTGAFVPQTEGRPADGTVERLRDGPVPDLVFPRAAGARRGAPVVASRSGPRRSAVSGTRRASASPSSGRRSTRAGAWTVPCPRRSTASPPACGTTPGRDPTRAGTRSTSRPGRASASRGATGCSSRRACGSRERPARRRAPRRTCRGRRSCRASRRACG